MDASDTRKIVLIIRPTRLDELITRFNTVQQAQFYVEHLGADFGDYLTEHSQYRAATGEVEAILRTVGRVQRVDRQYLGNFIFGADDIVVVLGQDGLVANTLKYLDRQHVVGVNPDPKRWDGVLLPFCSGDLRKVMLEEIANRRPIRRVTMAKASLNTGSVLYAVNDLFIGPRSHVSARYTIKVGDREERQSSSGIIVSTGMGSTGWLKSLYAGWTAAADTFGTEMPARAPDASFPWDANFLNFFVREPFPSKTTGASLVVGRIIPQNPVTIVSEMAEHGVIFSDGLEIDFLEFNAGTQATIEVAERVGLLVA
ncbi:sugar kinase [Tardiphaga sp. vice352]|uniref:sugar kinase n=1 Tax=unclassified Tardiphaga TaxID=2631404 RepID=UPI0011659E34|nr:MULTISPECIES: sugar kinase [unclassified Tardiphaga]MBC7583279.1 sugar kinase [Tardiphaga sp.]QDM18326.1 sugar kinase [Tardiphaga sp. vice278]QDM23330.1 sugar kinase [Tardiphaga sp. vice154]QDM28551.1 sugar kinase [Tardiphaga sp. vice304]QDM33650.1 sugar kinase [Tardiphaga sp. vice352]